MNPPRRFFWSVLAMAMAGVASAQATVFRGPPGLKGDVLVFPAPEATPSHPAELQGIVLLPVDAAGRSAFRKFQPDQPHLVSDLPLASRILLPQNQGSLYRYRRDRKGGGADFGYFMVHANGLASFL